MEIYVRSGTFYDDNINRDDRLQCDLTLLSSPSVTASSVLPSDTRSIIHSLVLRFLHHDSSNIMGINKLLAASAMVGCSLGAAIIETTRTLELAPEYFNGTVSVEHLSVAGNLDGFKMLTPAARASTDFWYFDVFSKATNQTLNIVFFNTGEFKLYPHPLALQVSGAYANGTDFYYEAVADSGVTITNGPKGITGDWKGVGTFDGCALDKPDVEYHISIDSSVMDINGNITFKSVSIVHSHSTVLVV